MLQQFSSLARFCGLSFLMLTLALRVYCHNLDDFNDYLKELKNVGVLNDVQITDIKSKYPKGLPEDEYEKIWKYSDLAFKFELKEYRTQSHEKIIENLYSQLIAKFFPNLKIKNLSIKTAKHIDESLSQVNSAGIIQSDTSFFLQASYSFGNEKYSDMFFNFKSYSDYWINNSNKTSSNSPKPYVYGNFFNDILSKNNFQQRVVSPYYSYNEERETIFFLIVNDEQFSKLKSQRLRVFSSDFHRDTLINHIVNFSKLGLPMNLNPDEVFRIIEKYREYASTDLELPVLLSYAKPTISKSVFQTINNPMKYPILLNKVREMTSFLDFKIVINDNFLILRDPLEKKNEKTLYKCSITVNGTTHNFKIPIKKEEGSMSFLKEDDQYSMLKFLNRVFLNTNRQFYLTNSGRYGAEYLLFLNIKEKEWMEEKGYYFKNTELK